MHGHSEHCRKTGDGARSLRNGSMQQFQTKYYTVKIWIKATISIQNTYSGFGRANKENQPCMAKCTWFPNDVTAAKLTKP